MKILIIMAGFFPGKKYGGPPVSVDNFCTLMQDLECYIVTKNHDKGNLKPYEGVSNGWNERNNCKVMYLSDDKYNKSNFEVLLKEINPDILYLQGLFQTCVFPCLQLAKEHSIRVLLAPRGELCAGALNIRKWKKIPYIFLIKLMGLVNDVHWQSTSEEETTAIKKLIGVKEDHIHRLDNIPTIPQRDYPRKEKKAGEGRFVFLSRIHPKKNLLFAISLFKRIQGKAVFDIYGPIEDADYWERCQEEIKNLPNNITVQYRGLVGHEQVHEVFSQYDAMLFPTLSENYGHVIAESLAVGTPVIISDQTPWLDLEKDHAGFALPLNKPSSFEHAIQSIINQEQSQEERVVTAFKKRTGIMRIKETYDELLNAII
jgi:glycosyltransferase involved in cell wall biosynthesis